MGGNGPINSSSSPEAQAAGGPYPLVPGVRGVWVRQGRRFVVDGPLVQLAHSLPGQAPRVLADQVTVPDCGPAALVAGPDLDGARAPHAHPASFAHLFDP